MFKNQIGMVKSVPEVPHARKNHCHIQTVRCSDYLIVTDRSARLDKSGCPGFCCDFKCIREREERIGSDGGAGERGAGFLDRDLCRIDPAHLPGPNAQRPVLVGKYDRVAPGMLADLPCKLECP
jgi:hypothetical protein